MKISLVIPAYNEEDEIAACLDAVAAQEVPFDEVFVVDNNCSDKTMQIAARYPFAILLHEPRQGVHFARDAGFNAATSQLIARIDADTLLPPGWTKQVGQLFADKTITAITGPAYYKDMPAPTFSRHFSSVMMGAAQKLTNNHPFLFGTNMALRKTAWHKVKGQLCYDKRFHEDVDLGIHLTKTGFKVAFVKDLIVGMSMRRVNNGPAEYYRYMNMTNDTYTHHKVNTSRLAYPYFMVVMALYPGMHIAKRAYDPKTGRFSLKKFIKNEEVSRKNPMA